MVLLAPRSSLLQRIASGQSLMRPRRRTRQRLRRRGGKSLERISLLLQWPLRPTRRAHAQRRTHLLAQQPSAAQSPAYLVRMRFTTPSAVGLACGSEAQCMQ